MAYTPRNTHLSEDGASEPSCVKSTSFWPEISDIPATPVVPPDNSDMPATPVAPAGGVPTTPLPPVMTGMPGMPMPTTPRPPVMTGMTGMPMPTTPRPPVMTGMTGMPMPTTPLPPVMTGMPGMPMPTTPLPPVMPGLPTTPVAPPGNRPIPPYPSGIPTTPVAPPGNRPSGPGILWPVFPQPSPNYPPIISTPSVSFYGQVRFLNASTNGESLDVYIDNQRILSGSTFATVSIYISVTDGFHTVTVRQTSGQILYQQSQAFVSGEKLTMVILDSPNGVTLARVSDMGCTNLPSGYGCFRVANMSYNGSNYDVRLFNNQTIFAGVGYKEVTSYKQTSAGNYTFYVTNSQVNYTTVRELPIIIFSALINPGCTNCGVSNPLLTFSVNIQAGRAYTSYIIGTPWSNLYQVFTLQD